MGKKLALPLYAIALLVALQIMLSPAAEAESDVSDGTYSIEYVITRAENDSVSMANDYFEKPAVLKMKNGEATIQFQLNHSKWITSFKTQLGSEYPSAEVIKTNEAEDTRIVQFKVEDLNSPLISKIHVTVPDIDYDHDYTIRFMFDQKTIKKAGSAKNGQAAKTKQGAAALNPQTGDHSQIALWAVAMVLSGALVVGLLAAKRRTTVPNTYV